MKLQKFELFLKFIFLLSQICYGYINLNLNRKPATLLKAVKTGTTKKKTPVKNANDIKTESGDEMQESFLKLIELLSIPKTKNKKNDEKLGRNQTKERFKISSIKPSRVDPPFRSINLFFNRKAPDLFSYITTDSELFGPVLDHKKACSFTRKMRKNFIREWATAAVKHKVAPQEILEILENDVTFEVDGEISEKCASELLKAAYARFKSKSPRVIVIGDVHGCRVELVQLLKEAEFWPGDLILFLGDLVMKGPESSAVVKMARELGSISVRGNHDFEVLRCSKMNNEVISYFTPHIEIASELNQDDLNWMKNCPWYIESSDLDSLFVHAGFVHNVKLYKQNPTMMTNLRSILPSQFPTSKFLEEWPWARLWEGPKTVFFGHDAERGLQIHDNAIGIDTGCVYGGRLTACILPERKLISVNASKQHLTFRSRKGQQ